MWGRPSKISIYSVLKNPDNKSNENKEYKTAHPKVPCQGFQEEPSIFDIVTFYRNHNGDTAFYERQSIVDDQGSAVENGNVSNRSIKILLVANKNA